METLKPSTIPKPNMPSNKVPFKFNWNWTALLFYSVFLVTAYIVLVPMVTLLYSSVNAGRGRLPFETMTFTFENYFRVLMDPVTYTILGNTVKFAVGAISICMIFAVFLAWVLARSNIPGRMILYGLILVPMAIPNVIYAIGWTQLLDPTIGLINLIFQSLFSIEKGPFNIYTLTGMSFVQGIHMVPTAFLMISATFSTLDPTLEEQSAICGKNVFTTTRRITLPILRPALLASLIYFMIVAIETFEIPGTLGLTARTPLLSTQIFYASSPLAGQLPDYGLVSVLGAILLVFAFILITLYQKLTKNSERFATVTGKGYRPRKIDLGKWKTPATIGVWLFVLMAVFLPFVVLVWTSLHTFYVKPSLQTLKTVSFEAYIEVFKEPQILQIIGNTLLLTVAAGAATAILGMLIGWLVIKSSFGSKAKNALSTLSFIPQAVPAIVTGLALMFVYIRLPFALYGSLALLIIGVTTRYLSFSCRSFISAQMQISKELEEASVVSGASLPRTMRKILIPLMGPVILNTFLWVAVHAMRELSVVIMLYSPKSLVISTKIWSYWEGGWTAKASVLGVILIIILSILVFGGQLLVNRLSKRYI